MATDNSWPPVYHDFRRYGLSFYKMPMPTIENLVELCDHYLECDEKYCSAIKTRARTLVVKTIRLIRQISQSLSAVSKTVIETEKEQAKTDYEFDVLQAADLPTDPKRTPERMKSELLELETAYVLRLDTVASLKRRIAMLEESLDPAINKCLF